MSIASQLWSLVPGPVRTAAQAFTDTTSSWAGRTVVAHIPNFVPEGMRKGISQFCGVEEVKREVPKLSPFEALPPELFSNIGEYLEPADFHAVVRASRTVSKARVEQLMGNEQAVGDLIRLVRGDIKNLLHLNVQDFQNPFYWILDSVGECLSPTKPRFTKEELKTICRGIKTFECKNSSFTLPMIELIVDFFPNLESLDIEDNSWNSRVSGASLKQISQLKKLKHLKLTGDKRDETSCAEGLQAIVDQSATTLESLHIKNIRISTGYQHLKALTQLRALTLPPNCSDADLQLLRHLPHLRELNLHRCWQITTAGFQVIAECARELQVLNLSDCTQLLDADLEALAKLTGLRILNVCSDRLTDIGIAHLAPLTKLTHLSLRSRGVTDMVMNVIGQFVHLEQLELISTTGITDVGITALLPLVHLKELRFEAGGNVTNAAFVTIGRLMSLEVLEVNHTGPEVHPRITDQGFAALHPLIHLRKLKFWGYFPISEVGLQAIVNLQDLEHLTLYRLQITDNVLQAVGQFLNLKNLELWQCTRITSRGITHLRPLVHLQKLVLTQCNVGDAVLEVCGSLPQLKELLLFNSSNTTNLALRHLYPLSKLRWFRSGSLIGSPDKNSAEKRSLQRKLPRLQMHMDSSVSELLAE